MFGFDGEYRRRPLQNLGGTSQTCDRDTAIRKAQQERQKRNELRQQNNSAVVLQSYARSFIHRQRKKQMEREAFDEYMSAHRHEQLPNDEHFAYLLPRIIFFYNCKQRKDGERLIEVCQQILRNPARLCKNATVQHIWQYRLRKLLDICVTQLSVPQTQQAIPLRMLETFTSESSLKSFDEVGSMVNSYLSQILHYLVERHYFQRLRCLLEEKCPPLDGETLHAPSQLADAIFQLILRPLLAANIPNYDFQNGYIIFQKFIEQILSQTMSDPIKSFLLPCLAERADFPFKFVIKALTVMLNDEEAEYMDVDNTSPASTNANTTFTGASALTAAAATHEKQQQKPKKYIFNSFLLNALFILDRQQIANKQVKMYLGDYVRIISKVSAKILYLPKPLDNRTRNDDEDSFSEDDDSDDEDIVRPKFYGLYEDCNNEASSVVTFSADELNALLECIQLLNESKRVSVITDDIEDYFDDTLVMQALCEICHNLMIYNKSAMFEYKLMYTLAFMPKVIRAVWSMLAAQSSQLGFSAPLTLISKGVVPKKNGVERTIPMIATFCMLFGRLLPTLHDAEFCEDGMLDSESMMLHNSIESPATLVPQTSHIRLMPFSINEIVQLSNTIKDISIGLVELAFPETRSNLNQHYRFVIERTESDDKLLKQQKHIWANLLKVVVFVLNQLHTRDLRLGFCPDSHWTVSRLNLPLDRPTDLPLTRSSRIRGIRPFQPIRDFTREDIENGPPMSTKQIRSITILREIPFVVPFNKRVGILQGLVAADKMRVQGNMQAFLQGPSIVLTVRRSHLYEDAYDKLRPENEPDLRVKFRVQFVSPLGLDEAGIDGGGIFREFLSELIKSAFDPNRGFFKVTKDNKLYPNPDARHLFEDYDKHYYFIGRILGKAIYENLLVELPLAEFFLTKLAGKYADVDIHQLASLDTELYKNLLYLKDYEGDVSDLNLDFTVLNNSLGQTEVSELKPNGQSIPVTNSNRIEYLQLMADYKLNVQIRQHCIAFRKGLSNVLPVEWLYMFSNKELQILISGAEVAIDLEDLKKHCKYGGEYNPEHPSIIAFWEALENFTDLQRRQLLKFVTSCSRPPLLGFKDLDPPFFIQNAGDMERLPTASTCTNLLKLPPFKTTEQMRDKLLYAIQSGVGFELS